MRIGQNCRIGASAVVDGWTDIGDETQIFPFASIGLSPQDLKYRGEKTRLAIGRGNIFREFVTIHRGTEVGGGLTSIGDRNLFMAYAHVAHDCRIGNDTIFGNGATLGGHVWVEDFATISAFSGVHQFCRVGEHAFIGGYSVVTKDALPYAKSVGNRARIYGLNTIGLIRRGFSEETLSKLKRAYRYLLVSRLNTSRALREIEQDDALVCPEVAYLVQFIRNSQRGVILRRPTRRTEEMVASTIDVRNRNRQSQSIVMRWPHRRQRPVSVSGPRRRPCAGLSGHRRRGEGRGVSGSGRGRCAGAAVPNCTGCRSVNLARASRS